MGDRQDRRKRRTINGRSGTDGQYTLSYNIN